MGKAKDVRAAVEAELSFDPLVDSADITVVDIGGHVNLTGTVPSYPQYLEAGGRCPAGRRGDNPGQQPGGSAAGNATTVMM